MDNLSLTLAVRQSLAALLILFLSVSNDLFGAVANSSEALGVEYFCTPPPPTVTSTITYCQNQPASPLSASGSNLIWGGSQVSGSVGGSSTLTSTAYVDNSFNNKRTNFITLSNNVTINSVDYYIDSWQRVNNLVLGIFTRSGTLIATSSTSTSRTAFFTPIRITNTFNFTLPAGEYSIGLVSGTGNLGFDRPSFPLTEPSGTLRITGVSPVGQRVFNNIQFTYHGGSSVASTPSTDVVG